MQELAKYIPEQALTYVAHLLNKSAVQLRISRQRLTKLGDYRPPTSKQPAQISVNHNLNPYSFLITLIHELAHAIAFNDHGRAIKSHGKEWKSTFRELMQPLLTSSVFPATILIQLERHMANPKASTGADIRLLRALNRFDENPTTYLEDLSEGSAFQLRNGKQFVKGARRRKHYLCKAVQSNRMYLINPLAEVTPLAS
jgi:hypothetical protein